MWAMLLTRIYVGKVDWVHHFLAVRETTDRCVPIVVHYFTLSSGCHGNQLSAPAAAFTVGTQ